MLLRSSILDCPAEEVVIATLAAWYSIAQIHQRGAHVSTVLHRIPDTIKLRVPLFVVVTCDTEGVDPFVGFIVPLAIGGSILSSTMLDVVADLPIWEITPVVHFERRVEKHASSSFLVHTIL